MTEETVDEIVASAMTDSQDSWEFRHYRERVSTYYEKDTPIVLRLLDVLALADEPLSFDNLMNQLKSQMEIEDGERVRQLLTLLQQDHYVERQSDSKHSFRFALVRRWWRMDRGLGG